MTTDTVVVNQDNSAVVTMEENTGVLLETENSAVVTLVQNDTIVSINNTVEYVLSGPQGPPGIPGAPGASTQFEYYASAIALGGNRAVTVNTAGQLVYPDTTQVNSWCLGITKHSAVVGEQVQVQILGTQQEPSWNWTPGEPIFVHGNGVLSQTQPTTGQLIVVGTAQTPTSIFIDINTPIYMG